MKTKEQSNLEFRIIIIGAWLAIAMLILLANTSCSTTRQVRKEEMKSETKLETSSDSSSHTEATTTTNTKVQAETVKTEECDTTVMVQPVINGSPVGDPVAVVIRKKATTTRKEYTEQQQERKEQGKTTVGKKGQLYQKTDIATRDKTVERTGLPWWAIGMIVMAIVVGAAVLLWRLKVF